MTNAITNPPPLARRSVLAGALGLIGLAVLRPATAQTDPSRTTPYGPAAPSPVPSAADASPDDTATPALARLMDRVTWGCTGWGTQPLAEMGVAGFLAQQLHSQPAALAPEWQARIDAMDISRVPVLQLALDMQARNRAARNLPTEDERKTALQAWQKDMRALQQQAAERFVLRAVYSPGQLREKMTWFWMNHFSIFGGKGNLRALVGDYEERAIRPHALGRFRDLLGATVRHPAMLLYLDNAQNAAGRINENYARELMELHTLGVDGGYSQQDVQELARVLTGVGVSLRPPGGEPPRMRPDLRSHYLRDGLFEFNPQRHDWEPKQLLGQPLRAEGLAEVEEALDRLARAPATARFITRKIALFLVGDNPPPTLLAALARTFERSGGDIAAVLEALFSTPEFRASLGQRFRDPVHYVLAGLRLAHGDGPLPLAGADPALGWLQRLAEPLYGRATPDGYPLDSAPWSGSGQMSTRFEIARALGAGAAIAPAARNDDMAPSPSAASPSPTPQRTPPSLAQTAYVHAMESAWSPATRSALSQATSPREWNLLFLASPEFMRG